MCFQLTPATFAATSFMLDPGATRLSGPFKLCLAAEAEMTVALAAAPEPSAAAAAKVLGDAHMPGDGDARSPEIVAQEMHK